MTLLWLCHVLALLVLMDVLLAAAQYQACLAECAEGGYLIESDPVSSVCFSALPWIFQC